MEMIGQLHAPTALAPQKEVWCPLDRRLGPRAGLDAAAKREIPAPTGNQIPVGQPVASQFIT